MKRLIPFLLILLFASPANGIDKNWTIEDSAWEAAYFTFHIIDWGQTRDLARHCSENLRIAEANPFLSDCPTLGAVNTYFFATAIAHLAISRALPTRFRRIFQTGTLGLQLYVVKNNHRMGLEFRF